MDGSSVGRSLRCARRVRARSTLALTGLLALGAVTTCVPAHEGSASERLIVIAGPANGQSAVVTDAIAAGVAAAISGLPARAIRLDDQCDRVKAAEVAAEVVRMAPELVIGHPCAGAALAAAPVYAAASVLFLAPATRHPALTDGRAALTVLRVAGRDDRQGWLAGAHLARLADGGTIALVSDKTRYGLGLITGAEAALRELGAAPPLIAHVASAERDYGELVRRLGESRVAGLIFGGAAHEAAILRRQLREAGISVPFIGGDALSDPAFIAAAGDAGEGTLVMLPPDPDRYPRAQDILRRLDPLGRLPRLEAIQSYAAVELWRAVAFEGALDATRPRAPQIASQIRSKSTETVLGPVRFAANGDAEIAAFTLHAWRDRRLVEQAR